MNKSQVTDLIEKMVEIHPQLLEQIEAARARKGKVIVKRRGLKYAIRAAAPPSGVPNQSGTHYVNTQEHK